MKCHKAQTPISPMLDTVHQRLAAVTNITNKIILVVFLCMGILHSFLSHFIRDKSQETSKDTMVFSNV